MRQLKVPLIAEGGAIGFRGRWDPWGLPEGIHGLSHDSDAVPCPLSRKVLAVCVSFSLLRAVDGHTVQMWRAWNRTPQYYRHRETWMASSNARRGDSKTSHRSFPLVKHSPRFTIIRIELTFRHVNYLLAEVFTRL
ncbi:hypothetical protein GW17_00001507 [Ensete ventricosum]|nr:hypothetical protein GW17_00001507 [Ensete ventricosum]